MFRSERCNASDSPMQAGSHLHVRAMGLPAGAWHFCLLIIDDSNHINTEGSIPEAGQLCMQVFGAYHLLSGVSSRVRPQKARVAEDGALCRRSEQR